MINPTTPLAISLPRSDWLVIERLLVAHYSGKVAEVDRSRCMPIVGVIGRSRMAQAEAVTVNTAKTVVQQTPARREWDRQRKARKRVKA